MYLKPISTSMTFNYRHPYLINRKAFFRCHFRLNQYRDFIFWCFPFREDPLLQKCSRFNFNVIFNRKRPY